MTSMVQDSLHLRGQVGRPPWGLCGGACMGGSCMQPAACDAAPWTHVALAAMVGLGYTTSRVCATTVNGWGGSVRLGCRQAVSQPQCWDACFALG